jgi:hypothetical protein
MQPYSIGTEPRCLGKQNMLNGRLRDGIDLYFAPTALLPALILCLARRRSVYCHSILPHPVSATISTSCILFQLCACRSSAPTVIAKLASAIDGRTTRSHPSLRIQLAAARPTKTRKAYLQALRKRGLTGAAMIRASE